VRAILNPIVQVIFKIYFAIVPAKLEQKLFLSILSRRAKAMPPKDGMHYILNTDNKLYIVTQQLASIYGDGVSPKHRMLNYHQFFYKRITPDERVLDIGSSEGTLTKAIADNTGAQITGIEIVPERVERAKEVNSHPNINYIVGDVTQAPLEESYDVIVMSNVLEHLPERVDFLKKAIRNTGTKRFLIRVPRFDRDWRIPLKEEVGVDYRLDDEHTIEYTPETFADEMEQAGLSILYLESRWGEFWAELSVNNGG